MLFLKCSLFSIRPTLLNKKVFNNFFSQMPNTNKQLIKVRGTGILIYVKLIWGSQSLF